MTSANLKYLLEGGPPSTYMFSKQFLSLERNQYYASKNSFNIPQSYFKQNPQHSRDLLNLDTVTAINDAPASLRWLKLFKFYKIFVTFLFFLLNRSNLIFCTRKQYVSLGLTRLNTKKQSHEVIVLSVIVLSVLVSYIL